MAQKRSWAPEDTSKRRFPVLPEFLVPQIKAIMPSEDRGLFYYPCEILMSDGALIDFVYLAEGRRWLSSWGLPPDAPLGPRFIDVTKVISLKESKNRLPPKFANELYCAGESGMGWTVFTVCFDDGSTAAFGNGNVIDFIHYPVGKSAVNVVDVIPHKGIDEPGVRSAPCHRWCIYEKRY